MRKLIIIIWGLLNVPWQAWRAYRDFDFAMRRMRRMGLIWPEFVLHPNALQVATVTAMSLQEADELLKFMEGG